MRHLHMEIIQNKMINYTIKNDYSTYAPATGTKIILISLFYSKKTHHLQKYVSIFILNSQTKDNKAKEAGCTCHIIVQQWCMTEVSGCSQGFVSFSLGQIFARVNNKEINLLKSSYPNYVKTCIGAELLLQLFDWKKIHCDLSCQHSRKSITSPRRRA